LQTICERLNSAACEPFEPVATTLTLSQLSTPDRRTTKVPAESATVIAGLASLAVTRTFSCG
jgi:hypothetical protein